MTDPTGSDGAAEGGTQVDFLLPTGVLIAMLCEAKRNLEEIKDALWDKAKDLPLFNRLKQPEWYTLVFVNRSAEQEECLDETLRLCDLQMYKPLFKVVEKKGDHEEKVLGNNIGWLIGKCLKDFDNSRNQEVIDFRTSMVEKCRQAITERSTYSWEQKVLYCYPPDIETSTELNSLVQDRLSPTVPTVPAAPSSLFLVTLIYFHLPSLFVSPCTYPLSSCLLSSVSLCLSLFLLPPSPLPSLSILSSLFTRAPST